MIQSLLSFALALIIFARAMYRIHKEGKSIIPNEQFIVFLNGGAISASVIGLFSFICDSVTNSKCGAVAWSYFVIYGYGVVAVCIQSFSTITKITESENFKN